MIKITRFLILAVVSLIFILPEAAFTYANKAPSRHTPNLRSSLTVSPTQSASIAENDNWVTECVYCPKSFSDLTDRSLQLDRDGLPHVAYGGKNLYYAWFDGAVWHYETVDDSPLVGRYASLALDEGGNPHISYLDEKTDDLKYAYKDDFGWLIQLVDSEGGRCSSIALDSQGYPHISYHTNRGDDLNYAFKSVNGWNYENIESNGYFDSNTSLALDKNDSPHIVYSNAFPDVWPSVLKYAYKSSAGWQIQQIDDGGSNPSIALDDAGYPHISYERPGSAIKYAFQDADGWHIQVVDSANTIITSIDLDNQGYPHIIWGNYSSEMQYAYQDKSGWYINSFNGEVSEDMSIALDSIGNPHIIFKEVGWSMWTTPLKYARMDGTGFQIEVVDEGGDVNKQSMVLDEAMNPHIIFQHELNELIYASRDQSQWNFVTLDIDGDINESDALAIDSNGYPHISFHDNNDGSLKYTFRDIEGWHTQVVDSLVSDTWYWDRISYSLAIDKEDHPHISYNHCRVVVEWKESWIDCILSYAYQDNDGWHKQILVDETTDINIYQTFALDNEGYPHISYSYGPARCNPEEDCDPYQLFYTYQDKNGWQKELVGTAIGPPTCLILDSHSSPHMCISSSSDNLQYATRKDDGWHFELLDGPVFGTPSITLDKGGYPHIGYVRAANYYGPSYVMYAYQDTSGWNFEVVDDHYASEATLALDSKDQPHISYISTSVVGGEYNNVGTLKYAYPPLMTVNPPHTRAYALPGSKVNYSPQVTNYGVQTDSYDIEISGNHWVTTAPVTVGPLLAEEKTSFDIQVTIPPTATLGSSDTATITLTSQSDPSVSATATLTTYAAIITYLPLVER